MKLSELFPRGAKVTLRGHVYEVRINTRATLQLEHDYPDEQQLRQAFASALSKMKSIDMVNILFAGLLHTKAFSSKDELIDAMDVGDFPTYVDAIVVAVMNNQPTPEQIEKLEVMAQTSKAKKNDRSGTMQGNGPSTELSAN